MPLGCSASDPPSCRLGTPYGASAGDGHSHSHTQDGERQQCQAAKAQDALRNLRCSRRKREQRVAAISCLEAQVDAWQRPARRPTAGHSAVSPAIRLPTHQGVQARGFQQCPIRQLEHRDEPAPEVVVPAQLQRGRALRLGHRRANQAVEVDSEPAQTAGGLEKQMAQAREARDSASRTLSQAKVLVAVPRLGPSLQPSEAALQPVLLTAPRRSCCCCRCRCCRPHALSAPQHKADVAEDADG